VQIPGSGPSSTVYEPGDVGLVLDGLGNITVIADSAAHPLMAVGPGDGTAFGPTYTPAPDPEPSPPGYSEVRQTLTPPPPPGA